MRPRITHSRRNSAIRSRSRADGKQGQGRRIGRVDAVFADYLLVRSGFILPVDLYVPRDAVDRTDGALRVELGRRAAYDAGIGR